MFTFASVGHGGHSVELKLCLTRNLRSTRVKETALQNVAKPPWFKLHTVFITCKACNNVHVWFSHVAYWNCRQFSVITRFENSSLVLLGRTSSRWDLAGFSDVWRVLTYSKSNYRARLNVNMNIADSISFCFNLRQDHYFILRVKQHIFDKARLFFDEYS